MGMYREDHLDWVKIKKQNVFAGRGKARIVDEKRQGRLMAAFGSRRLCFGACSLGSTHSHSNNISAFAGNRPIIQRKFNQTKPGCAYPAECKWHAAYPVHRLLSHRG